MPRRAVLYVRLSDTDEASTSIARQESDLRTLAEREGWEVVRVLADEGISGRKSRANAAEALRMLRDGEAEVLAVWKLDRWSGQGVRALGDLVDALDSSPGSLFVALQDGLRSDAAAWRLTAAVRSEVARTEAENTATRVRSSIRALRYSGCFPGGVVPFGYRPAPNPDGPGRVLVVDPPEAAVVRDTAAAVLGGSSLSRAVGTLNAQRVPTTRSPARAVRQAGRPVEGLGTGAWDVTSLKKLLTSDHLLGRVRHHGEIVTTPDGLPAQAWPPVLDRPTWHRLRDHLVVVPREVVNTLGGC